MCGCQLCLQERQGSEENDEDLLVGGSVAARPDKYLGLDLTLIGCIETSAVYTSGVIKCIRDNINAYDTSDEAVGIEAEIEIDIRS